MGVARISFVAIVLSTASTSLADDAADVDRLLKRINEHRRTVGLWILKPSFNHRRLTAFSRNLQKLADSKNGLPESYLVATFEGPFDPGLVDSWMGGLYPRISLLDPRLEDAFVAFAGANPRHAVFTPGKRSRVAPTETRWLAYPAKGQTEVPLGFVGDVRPTIVPADAAPGFPITATLYGVRWRARIEAVKASLADDKGQYVPVWIVEPRHAPARVYEPSTTLALVPQSPLRPATTYVATFEARVNRTPWKKSWTFSTRKALPAETQKTKRSSGKNVAAVQLLNELRLQARDFRYKLVDERWRLVKTTKLRAVTNDEALSAAATLHSQYLVKKDAVGGEVDLRREVGPEATEEGRRAANGLVRAAFVKPMPKDENEILRWMGFPLHRTYLLDPYCKAIGWGVARGKHEGWEWRATTMTFDYLYSRRKRPSTGFRVIVWPAFQDKIPLRITPNDWVTTADGYPITARFHRRKPLEAAAELVEVDGTLSLDPAKATTLTDLRARGVCRTLETILHRSEGGGDSRALYLFAVKPLKPHTTYAYSLTATVSGKRWVFQSVFRTGAWTYHHQREPATDTENETSRVREQAPAKYPESAVVDFEIVYRFQLTDKASRIRLRSAVPVSLPHRQEVKKIEFTPNPSRLFKNAEGRTIAAEFDVKRIKGPKTVRIRCRMNLFRNDLERTACEERKPSRRSLKRYLLPERQIESDHPRILEVAKRVSSAEPRAQVLEIVNLVADHMTYVSKPGPGELGALRALGAAKGDCSEYTDLTVALCRAKGIPARRVGGYALGNPPADTLHCWAEVFLDRAGWVAVDASAKDVGHPPDKLPNLYVYFDASARSKLGTGGPVRGAQGRVTYKGEEPIVQGTVELKGARDR